MRAPWLKVIITGRPEADIRRFFDAPTRSSHLRHDLAIDQEASVDSRPYDQSQFDIVPSNDILALTDRKNQSSIELFLVRVVFSSSSRLLFLPLSIARTPQNI